MKKAFSLVELAIVLVILGLLVGGILAGQSLIRASELRAVGAEYQRYTTALHAFRDKYFAFPGDMANATNFWGTATYCPGTAAQPSTGIATCNGNGDGQMQNNGATSNEVMRFWQHLANAGLIEGQYTGVQSDTNPDSMVAGLNIPKSKLSGGGWGQRYYSATPTTGHAFLFSGQYGNWWQFGANTTNSMNQGVILRPEEMWNIDKKIDDGMPARGTIIVRFYTPCTNAANGDSLDAEYKVSNPDIACVLIARKLF